MEGLYNWLYILHPLLVWGAMTAQIRQIYRTKKVRDINLYFAIGMVISEFVALPLALSSEYWAWKVCHVVSAVLVVILLIGVWCYKK